MRVRVLPATDQAAVARVWSALDERVGAGRVAVSWAWTSTWLRHYGATVVPRFAVVERAGEPVAAVLLVTSRRSAVGVRRLHLGTAGEPAGAGVYVEYNDLLCAPADRPAVVAALARTIRVLPGWDELDAPGFGAATAEALREVLPLDHRPQQSWTMRLPTDRTVLEGFKGSTRRLVRQSREALDPDKPECVTDPATAREVLAELAALHQQRWLAVGRPGVFASPRLTGFLTDLTDAWLSSQRLLLYRLPDAHGATIGAVVGFVEDGRFLYYQAGFRATEDTRSRPGLLCHAEFAEHARGLGLREYELLAGDAQFKRQLSGGESNPLVWGRWTRPSLRNRALDLARRARQTLPPRSR